jgi:hypothetical protein
VSIELVRVIVSLSLVLVWSEGSEVSPTKLNIPCTSAEPSPAPTSALPAVCPAVPQSTVRNGFRLGDS